MDLANYSGPILEMDNQEVSEDQVSFFIVAGYVLLALGATVVLGAMAWCFMHARESFTGYIEKTAGGLKFKIGCN